jgi:hypothetical protein
MATAAAPNNARAPREVVIRRVAHSTPLADALHSGARPLPPQTMLTGKQLEAYLAHVVLGRKLPQRNGSGRGPDRRGKVRHAMKTTRTGFEP